MNFMEKIFVLFICVLFIGGVFAADDWGDINVDSSDSGENGSQGDVDEDVDSQDNDDFGEQSFSTPGDVADQSGLLNEDRSSGNGVSFDREGNGEFYKTEFYIAVGLGVLILGITGFFVWLWIRGPKNKWE